MLQLVQETISHEEERANIAYEFEIRFYKKVGLEIIYKTRELYGTEKIADSFRKILKLYRF